MAYKIQKGVPLPPLSNSRAGYPYKEMEVGDSFVVPLVKVVGAFSSSRDWGIKQEPVRKFASRKISETSGRVWRIV